MNNKMRQQKRRQRGEEDDNDPSTQQPTTSSSFPPKNKNNNNRMNFVRGDDNCNDASEFVTTSSVASRQHNNKISDDVVLQHINEDEEEQHENVKARKSWKDEQVSIKKDLDALIIEEYDSEDTNAHGGWLSAREFGISPCPDSVVSRSGVEKEIAVSYHEFDQSTILVDKDEVKTNSPSVVERRGKLSMKSDSLDTYERQEIGRQLAEEERVGAHPISGNRGRRDPSSSELEADVAVISNPPSMEAQQPYTVEATVVPELVTVRAVEEDKRNGEHEKKPSMDPEFVYYCGLKCGYDRNASSRRTFIFLAGVFFLIVIAVAVLIVAVVGGRSDGSDERLLETSVPTPSPAPTSIPTPLETKPFFTTLNSSHCFYGHMFDITAKIDLEIVSLEIHTESIIPGTIEVWTKEGEYHGFEKDSFRWAEKEVFYDVLGMGKDELTPLPRFTTPLRFLAGERHAIYVTSSTETICFQERTTPDGVWTIEYGEVVYQNEDMNIHVGTGVQHRFQDHGPPNVFNGVIEYAFTDFGSPGRITANPTLSQTSSVAPSLSPYPSISEHPSGSQTLLAETFFTTLDYTHYYYGHMFYITAKQDLYIVGLDIHTRLTTEDFIEIWTKEGEYLGYEKNQSVWSLVDVVEIVGEGASSLTPMPRFEPLFVEAGKRRSLYYTSKNMSIYFQERTTPDGESLIDYGEVVYNHTDFDVNVGTGVGYLFNGKGKPNVFNGAIKYIVESVPNSPTNNPPTASPPVSMNPT